MDNSEGAGGAPETPSTKAKVHTVEDAVEEISALLDSGRITSSELSATSHIVHHQVPSLKEKVSKLKSLLGRSAKVQRETKVELEQTQKRLAASQESVERLNKKVEKLATRPTHMELLADFETNFDRALLHAQQQQQQQKSGEETSAPTKEVSDMTSSPTSVMDTMLLQELSEARNRIEILEKLQSTWKDKSIALEQQSNMAAHETKTLQHEITSLKLELKMAQMQVQHSTREKDAAQALLEEMQLELDLVTKANHTAHVKAVQWETDSTKIQRLETQVNALQEWALASAQAKSLAMEHVQLLEHQLQEYRDSATPNRQQRVLVHTMSSMVIGAGDVGVAVIALPQQHQQSSVAAVLVQWKFDVSPCDMSVDFMILKGTCDASSIGRAEIVLHERSVTGGAAGEVERAFSDSENTCTLIWSNQKSWVRPRTIKYTVEAVVGTSADDKQ